MAMTGMSQYSKVTRGLRRPGTHIKDQEFELIFIYPMLISEDLRKYEDLFRNFVTVSFLDEIYASNFLKTISIASRVKSIEDESGNEVSTVNIAGVALTGSGQNTLQASEVKPRGQISDQHKREIIAKLQEKMIYLRRLLKTNRRYEQFHPQIKMITMENLIDIPVIVGTKSFTINPAQLLWVVVMAIALNKPLNNKGSINEIFRELKSMNPDKIWRIMNRLTPTEESAFIRFKAWLMDLTPGVIYRSIGAGIKKVEQHYMGSIEQHRRDWINLKAKFPTITKTLSFKRSSKPEKPDESEEYFDEDESLHIQKLIKKKFDETKLNFGFMVDDDLMRTQHGLKRRSGQVTSTFERISPQAKTIFGNIHLNFINALSLPGTVVLRSFSHILYPEGSNLNYLDIKDSVINNDLNEALGDIITNKLWPCIRIALETSGKLSPGEEGDYRTRKVNKICEGLTDTQFLMSSYVKTLPGIEVKSPVFTMNEYSNFIGNFNKIADECNTQTKKYELLFADLTEDSCAANVVTEIRSVIEISLNSFFNKYKEEINKIGNVALSSVTQKEFLEKKKDELGKDHSIEIRGNSIYIVDETTKQGYVLSTSEKDFISVQKVIEGIPEIKKAILEFFYFLFMVYLQEAICQFSSIYDVEFETTQNDALDLPNYTLVLPVEILRSAHFVYVAKGLRNLLKEGTLESLGGQALDISENYVRGFVKSVLKKLDVPNVIIVDKQKGDVYYQFMFMSSVKKQKISTMETYVESALQEINAPPTPSYY